MEKEKYYTPDISEFCIGFEYEYTMPDYPRYLDRTKKDEWVQETFGAGGNDTDGLEIDNVMNLLDKNQIRVRCLSYSDYIDLKFIPISNTWFNRIDKAGAINLNLNDDGSITIFHMDRYKYESKNRYQTEFKVKLKNKSELEKFLKQISY
jgi:hypothetical protein